MKVLRQDWVSPSRGCVTSISKNRVQLDATFVRIKKQEPEVELEGEADEITIPDDSPFVNMVKQNTVFLHEDEMDLIYDAPENA